MSYSLIYNTLFFIFGLLFFSSFSSVLFFNIISIGLYIIEPALLAIVAMLLVDERGGIKLTLREWTYISIVTAVFLYLLLIGAAETNLKDSLSSGRGIFYLFLLLPFASSIKEKHKYFIFYITFGILIGDLLASLYNMEFSSSYRGISAMNIISLSLLCTSTYLIGGKIRYLLVIPLCFVAVFLSGFRVIILAIVFGLLTPHLISILKDGLLSGIKKIVLAMVALISLPVLIINIAPYFSNTYSFAVYRIVNRSLDAFHALGSDHDSVSRYESIIGIDKVYNYIDIYPNGFLMIGKKLVGFFNDAPYLHILSVFGTFLGFLIIFTIYIVCIANLFIIIRQKAHGYTNLLFASQIPIMVIVTLINGRFLYIPYEVVLFSLILGYLMQRILTLTTGKH
ncbi:hypothetical protein AB4347_00340 [Vibrio breoganii]